MCGFVFGTINEFQMALFGIFVGDCIYEFVNESISFVFLFYCSISSLYIISLNSRDFDFVFLDE